MEVKRGKIQKVVVEGLANHRSGLYVTAVRNEQSKLQLFVWANDETEPRAVKIAGIIKDLAIHHFNATKRFVTAVRDSEDNLRVIAWEASEDGRSIQRLGTAIGPKVMAVDAISSQFKGIAIAVRDFDERLMMIHYELEGDSVIQKASETFDKASKVSMFGISSNAVALRNSEGKLRLMHFLHSENFVTLQQKGFGTGGPIRDVEIGGGTGLVGGEWFTFSIGTEENAVRTGLSCLGGRLIIPHGLGKLIGWEIEDFALNGNFIRTREKQLASPSGIAKKVDTYLLENFNGPDRLITAHLSFGSWCRALPSRRGNPLLKLIVWDHTSKDNEFIKVTETNFSGDYTDIDITQIKRLGRQSRFVVALRGKNGELKVTVWGLEVDP